MTDGDLSWLQQCLPEKDLLNIRNERVKPLYKLIANSKKKDWPITIGLFGSWGCGKTTYLGYLNEMLESQEYEGEPYKIIYFNAWKYAGFMEVVPALIYKIIKHSGNDKVDEKIMIRLMLSLGEKYSNQIGEWAKKYMGINPVDLLKDIVDIKNKVDIKTQILDEYYTQIDKVQDLLNEHFQGAVAPTVVLIDELDRCDPGEAFELIKQLRIFFSMRKIPIIFVLSANPEPIGLAIKHQYGLNSDVNDYESKRILEKFVDIYVDMSAPLYLGNYMKDLWSKLSKSNEISLISSIDDHVVPVDYSASTVKNSTVFNAITTNNYLYSNLRVLEKSLSYVMSQKTHKTQFLWVAWHLEILNQMHESLRRDIAKLAPELGWISANAHINIIRHLNDTGQINQDGNLKKVIEFNTDKGRTAFSTYRSWFWELSKIRLEEIRKEASVESSERAIILKTIMSEHHVMDFVILMTLVTATTTYSVYIENSDWVKIPGLNHFSWLLANY